MNATPLIDVLLVLLIVLLVTMPSLTHSINVDLPTLDGAASAERIKIEIDFDGTVLWNDTRVDDAIQLERYLLSASARRPQPAVQVEAHRAVRYDSVANVLAAIQRSGIRKMGFIGNDRFVN